MTPRMEARSSARIVNARGLHARPCHALAALALRYSSTVRVSCDGREVDGKSMLELMTVAASQGSLLEFSAEGADAHELVSRLAELVGTGFGEES
jgi:phosphocarrier protein